MNEWENEPDEFTWRDRKTDYRCNVWRTDYHLYLNGVVELPPKHKLYGIEGKRLNELGLVDRPLHGHEFPNNSWRLPWSKFVWRIQMSFNGNGDLYPSMSGSTNGHVYRNMAYAKRETEALARRIAEAAQ